MYSCATPATCPASCQRKDATPVIAFRPVSGWHTDHGATSVAGDRRLALTAVGDSRPGP